MMITPNHADVWSYYSPDDYMSYAVPVVGWSPNSQAALVCSHDGILVLATSVPGFTGFGIRPEVAEGEEFELRASVRLLADEGQRINAR